MIIKRNGHYQVKVKDAQGRWASQTFPNKKDAQTYESQLKQRKYTGQFVTSAGSKVNFHDYFTQWFESVRYKSTAGWRNTQECLYEKHVRTFLGRLSLGEIHPPLIRQTLNEMAGRGLSAQSILHVYNLLAKCFSDAVNVSFLIHRSPVLKDFRPQVPRHEAKFLTLPQIRALLLEAEGHPFGLAVWLGIYLGLRVGEVQALRWEDVDLERGIVHIRRTYVKAECTFRNYPKGRKHHSKKIPQELLTKLKQAKEHTTTQLVVVPPGWKMLDYWKYLKVLKQLCRSAKVPVISTHSLRHSSSELWMEHGASRDDLRIFFAHADGSTTDRYVHDRGSRLHQVAQVIRLFPESSGSQKDPNSEGTQNADSLSG